VKEHDGRAKAVDDARGGRVGSAGLVTFAIVVWAAAALLAPALVLALATSAWIVTDLTLWFAIYGREPQPRPRAPKR
jgi:hypothetical protein